LGLVLTELVSPGHLSLLAAMDRMSAAPARILGLQEQGEIAVGHPANLVVFDPAARWQVDPTRFLSRSRNSAFGGRVLSGRVVHTLFRGRTTVRDGVVAGAFV
jgi:dihydroorotase